MSDPRCRTFEQFLRECQRAGITELRLKLKELSDNQLGFYIHPANANGKTFDYKVIPSSNDPETSLVENHQQFLPQ